MTSIVEPRRHLLIVFLEDYNFEIERILDEHALRDWRNSPFIKLLKIKKHRFHDRTFVKSKIKHCALVSAPNIFYDVFILGSTVEPGVFEDRKAERWGLQYCGIDIKAFQRKLKSELRALRIDWFSQVADLLKHAWLRKDISEEHIKQWIDQFGALGNNDWIGKKLIQSLYFWPESKILEALDITPSGLRDFEHICIFTEKIGKSADILRNLVAKRLSSFPNTSKIPEIGTPKESIDTDGKANIIWLEDWLLTATEVLSLISSLFGEFESGRKPKVAPLTNTANLYGKNIQFRFALATDFGQMRLQQKFDDKKLNTCRISCHETLKVLTTYGVEALSNGKFYFDQKHHIVRDPINFFRMPAFEDEMIWTEAEERNRAIDFCTKIGKQLFGNYINAKVKQSGWTAWPQRRVSQCALGMKGLGLSLAFAHTVPKASLPLFWSRGIVTIKNRKAKWSVDWIPLFPDAD